MTPPRTRLTPRHPGESIELEAGGQTFTATVGFDEAHAPKEIFLRTNKPGSALDAILADAAVAISVALQCGVTAEAMRKSVGRLPGATPFIVGTAAASPIGAALDVLAELEAKS